MPCHTLNLPQPIWYFHACQIVHNNFIIYDTYSLQSFNFKQRLEYKRQFPLQLNNKKCIVINIINDIDENENNVF